MERTPPIWFSPVSFDVIPLNYSLVCVFTYCLGGRADRGGENQGLQKADITPAPSDIAQNAFDLLLIAC